ncbi:MAG: hypothetical protein WBW41_19115 [Verrucomicrobiia bacterium]
MKPTQYKKWLVLAFALVNGLFAAAQSNGVPGPTAYSAFSRFITERNIFDPNRYAHSSTRPYRATRSAPSTPTFTLVGTMSYEKGMFAFFDGNNSDLRKVLYQSDTNGIAGYTVAEVTLTGVKLQTADKKQTVEMKIGEMMRQEGNEWQPAGRGELAASTVESAAPADEGSSSDAGTAPASASEPNDILKKLMQQREQELK